MANEVISADLCKKAARLLRLGRFGEVALMLLAGCGGDGGSAGSGGVTLPVLPVPPVTVAITVSVSGLRAGQQVTLANNGGDSSIITSNGTFSFSKPVPMNGSYAVTIAVPPSAESCTLSGATGVVQNSATISVAMSCGPTTLHSFSGPEGNSEPDAFMLSPNVVLASDGNIYGTIARGGTYGFGTIFSLTPAGKLTVLHHFAGGSFDGKNPEAPLVEGPGGDLYGTSTEGGVGNSGTIFKISRGGTFTLLHSFSYTEGSFPRAALLQDGGDFYGTTETSGQFGFGAIFKMASNGNVTVLYSFHGADGAWPWAPLIQGSDGNFYGTTSGGGIGGGRVFRITPSGALTSLHDFNGADGSSPFGPIIRDNNGNIYGTAYSVFPNSTNTTSGVIFKISASGQYSVLHQFVDSDGFGPLGGLTWGLDGNIYGTTSGGGEGVNAAGTIFRISPAGDFTRLHTFKTGSEGRAPRAALIQDQSGVFYGTTGGGGSYNLGTIFKF